MDYGFILPYVKKKIIQLTVKPAVALHMSEHYPIMDGSDNRAEFSISLVSEIFPK